MSITETRSIAELRTTLPVDDSAPADARLAMRELDPSAALMGDAMLLASELVTNAVQHSGCGDEDQITLHAELCRGGVRIEVGHPVRSESVPRVAAGADHFGGMGLRVVEALSDRWGFERDGEQVVWAEIARA
jgi:anti-sigma regulatory factor (Ser/Thr protein kinase)